MFQFYGQFEPPVDHFIWSRYFPDKNTKGIFVECGAFDGATECSCRFFEESLGWTGYNLEPVPHIFEKLRQNRTKSRNLNVGLSDRDGEVAFQSVIHPEFGRDTTIGSIEHSPELKAALEEAGCIFEEIRISVISWNTFIEREKVKQIDLMVLDVEGHELAVLSGMHGSSVLPKVMCIEFGHAQFNEVRAELDALGYEYDINSHANAYFIRRDALGLFAFRQLTHSNDLKSEIAELEAELQIKQVLIAALEKREAELVHAYNTLVNSRGWRLLQRLRKLAGLR